MSSKHTSNHVNSLPEIPTRRTHRQLDFLSWQHGSSRAAAASQPSMYRLPAGFTLRSVLRDSTWQPQHLIRLLHHCDKRLDKKRWQETPAERETDPHNCQCCTSTTVKISSSSFHQPAARFDSPREMLN